MNKLPNCEHPHGKTCKANIKNNKCIALNNTTFINKLCSFYKIRDELRKENKNVK